MIDAIEHDLSKGIQQDSNLYKMFKNGKLERERERERERETSLTLA